MYADNGLVTLQCAAPVRKTFASICAHLWLFSQEFVWRLHGLSVGAWTKSDVFRVTMVKSHLRAVASIMLSKTGRVLPLRCQVEVKAAHRWATVRSKAKTLSSMVSTSSANAKPRRCFFLPAASNSIPRSISPTEMTLKKQLSWFATIQLRTER